MREWLLRLIEPLWLRDIRHREDALLTLAQIWERDHHA